MLQQDTGLYLGPATVSRTVGKRIQLRRPDQAAEEWAEPALAFAYQPVAGDVVLVAAQEDRVYVIGVLQGRGPSVLSFPGDVTLSAPQGSIHFDAAKAVTTSAPAVEIRAEALDIEARTLVQRFESALQWVKDLFETKAGRTRMVSEGTHLQIAERTFIRSEKESKIDGEKIYLG
ncbi:MAG: DUF3540 domain-containing protein [Planctomycetaceae bacterium]|nr:DUF3540 domain-containing protein [Planctomycetaceae bacterium]